MISEKQMKMSNRAADVAVGNIFSLFGKSCGQELNNLYTKNKVYKKYQVNYHPFIFPSHH